MGSMGYTMHDACSDRCQPAWHHRADSPGLAKATLLLSCWGKQSRVSLGSCNYVINFLKAPHLSSNVLGTITWKNWEAGTGVPAHRVMHIKRTSSASGCLCLLSCLCQRAGTPCTPLLLVTADTPWNGAWLKGMGLVYTLLATGCLGRVPWVWEQGLLHPLVQGWWHV